MTALKTIVRIEGSKNVNDTHESCLQYISRRKDRFIQFDWFIKQKTILLLLLLLLVFDFMLCLSIM
jgi:hypothetical protein